MDTDAGCGLVVTLRRDARRLGSLLLSGVPVAAGPPMVVPSVELVLERMHVEALGDVLPASVMPPGHWKTIAELVLSDELENFLGGQVPFLWRRVGETRLISDTVWVPCLRVFVSGVPDVMTSPVDVRDPQWWLLREEFNVRFPWARFPSKYVR